MLAFDHVVGADPAIRRAWKGRYDVRTQLNEPFVLFGFLAGITSLHFTTGVLILPQGETVLVAKQAAELDLLSGGRLRLGVGVGWNPVECVALAQDFAVRGARLDEQADLLRQLWTEPSVTYQGRFDQVHGAGLCPLPVQRPIPLDRWQVRPAIPPDGPARRWLVPAHGPWAGADSSHGSGRRRATAAGRDPATLGMEGRLSWHADPTTLLSRRGGGDAQARPTSGSTR